MGDVTQQELLNARLRISALEKDLKECRRALAKGSWQTGSKSATDEMKAYLRIWRGHWPQLAKETGVSVKWIRRFYGGNIPNPGVRALEALLRHKQMCSGPPHIRRRVVTRHS